MSATPWNSIAESVVPPGARELTLAEATASPCATCSTAPCCTHLPLTTFQVTTLTELDHANYLLNFDRIELGLSSSGEWSAYYAQPCRFLDRDDFGCTIHDQPEQPRICVHYNPYKCWYRAALTRADSDEFVRLDRARMDLLLPHIRFAEDRSIASVPAWDEIVALMAAHDDQPGPVRDDPPVQDPTIEAWLAGEGAPTDGPPPAPDLHSADDLADPCDGCDAYCCTTLVFPQSVPTHVSNFDYMRFCLGFPGVEVLVADGTWSLVVRTTCRHLVDGRCGIFGEPERPLICKYYDAARCDYKGQFGDPRPDWSMRVRLEQYPALVEQLSFDPDGNLVAMPPMEQLRQTIEAEVAGGRRMLPIVATSG